MISLFENIADIKISKKYSLCASSIKIFVIAILD